MKYNPFMMEGLPIYHSIIEGSAGQYNRYCDILSDYLSYRGFMLILKYRVSIFITLIG